MPKGGRPVSLFQKDKICTKTKEEENKSNSTTVREGKKFSERVAAKSHREGDGNASKKKNAWPEMTQKRAGSFTCGGRKKKKFRAEASGAACDLKRETKEKKKKRGKI